MTVEDGLVLVLRAFGDPQLLAELEPRVGVDLTLHEEIALEFASVRAPLEEVVDWVREHVHVRPGFRELAEAHRPTILSSGFVELIEPVLAREGVSGLDVLANRLDARPGGWRVLWRDEAQCAECGEPCKRGALSGDDVVYVGDGYSDRCAALSARRVFARDGLAAYLDRRGIPYEHYRDLRDVADALEVHHDDVIVDRAVYARGARLEREAEPDGVAAGADTFVWVALAEPTPEEFEAVRREFDLHELAVEDAVKAHQRPKLERYGDTLFVVLKTAVHEGPTEMVETGELMLFVGADFLVTVRHGSAGGMVGVRERLERQPGLLALGPTAVMYAVIDRVVDGYRPVAEMVAEDIEELESAVFSDARTNPVERIYTLRREVLEFQRAVAPLADVLDDLMAEQTILVRGEIRTYLRDVADHIARLNEQVDGFRELLGGILQANLTRVSVRQNEDMRKISAWVAIVAVPTAVAGIYGMNFEHMPELGWRFGYPGVLALMAVVCGGLYVRFQRSGWL